MMVVNEEEIKFIDLFSGVGGFHKGLTDTGGYQCVWANEWDKYAASVYRHNFPETPLSTDDIRKVPADSIPDHDLLCAGFPCQAFSVAGKRRGFEETRGTLFYEIARIAERKRPRLLLLENVKGLLSHDNGKTFGVILEVLGGIGYRPEWQVLNSKWFGVPQNRERVFIIGHLGEEPTGTVFPITETSGEPNIGDSGEQVANTLQSPGHACGNYRGMNMIHEAYPGELREYSEYSPTISTPGGGGHLPYVANCVDVDGYLRTGARPRDENGKPQLLPIGYRRIRRLTPVECERLQGFPDGWTDGLSDTQRYKCMGNAVTVNVIKFLGKRIHALH